MQRHGYRDWDKIFAFCRPYILSHKKEFKVLFATIFLGTFISNLIPLIWGKLIDSLSNINIGKLLLFLLLYAVVTLLLFFMGVFESFLGAKLDYKIEGEIKQVMLAKALRMSCAELDAFDTGELMSRITSDAGSIIQFVIDALTSIVTIVINVITALVFSFEISPHLSAISLAFVPLSILSNIAFKNKFRELNERQKQYSDSLSSFLVNTLNHIFDIKAYRLEENETKQYANFLDKGWMLHKRNYRLNSFASAFSSVASVASVSVTILISGLLINKGLFTIGKMISFQGYIDKLSTSVNKLLGMNYSAQTTCVAIDRIQNLLSKSDDFEKSLKINETGIHIREISFEEVFFQYKEGIPVLENVSLSIREPGLYAFVGENGCGKTTILKLIMRYYRVVNGQIKLNDDCINDMSTLCVRSSIGYYGKSVYIRNDSLLNNLCLGSSMQIYQGVTAESYIGPDEIYYAYYMKHTSGPFTQESYDWLEEQGEEFAPMLEVQRKVAAGELSSDAMLAFSSLQQKYSVYSRVINQNINYYLKEHPGAWLVYESGYKELFGFTGDADVQDTLLAGLACALCFSGLFSMERRGGMETILCTTPLGRKRTVRAKLAVSAGVAVLIAAASCLPHLIQVLRDYGLPALFAPAMSISEFESLPALFTLSDVLLFWFVCRIAACLCMGAITLTLGRVFGNLLPALFVSAVGYCLPALLSLSGMDGGIEWLGFWPLFHAANFFTTQGYAGEEGLPYNNAWVILLLLVVVLLGTATLWGYLRDCYEWKGSILDAAS